MKNLYFYSLLFILFILQACTLEPKGEHFVTIDPTPKTPNIQVNLNLDADTLYVPRMNVITFAYGMNGNDVNWSRFIINGKETDQMTYKKDTVKLQWIFNDNGGTIYPLEMQILYKAKTGSLADIMNSEGVLYSKKWILKVVDEFTLVSKITKTEFTDGSLKLQWSRFPGTEFTSYKVYKVVDYLHQQLVLIGTINSRDQTSIVDNTFHGEPSNYYIMTNDAFRGPITTVRGPIPVVSVSNTSAGDMLISWTKAPYYKNLKGYRIWYQDERGVMQTMAETNNSSIESCIIANPLFANNYAFYFTPLPLTDNYFDETNLTMYLSTNFTASYGVPTPKYVAANSGMAPITYLQPVTYGKEILVFDHQKMTTTRRITLDAGICGYDVSANNKYMVVALFSNYTVYFENLTDTTKSKKINLATAYPQITGISSVSDVGTGMFFNGHTAIVYDYLNERQLAQTNVLSIHDVYSKISPSGNFFLCLSNYSTCEYYRYKDNQITLLEGPDSFKDKVIYADYLPGTNEKMVRLCPNKIEVVDCNTWVTEKSWPLPNGFTEFYNLDRKTGKLFFREKNKMILFDVINGKREELRDIGGDPNNRNAWKLFYNAGQVLWGEGKAMI